MAYEVPAGRSLVLEIAGARCGFAENPNTGEPASAQTRWASTTLELAHDPTAPSLLELPVE